MAILSRPRGRRANFSTSILRRSRILSCSSQVRRPLARESQARRPLTSSATRARLLMLLELIRTRFERKIIAPGTLGGPKIAEGSNVGLFLKAPAFFAAQRSLAPDLPGPGSDSDPLDGTLDHYPLRAGGRVPRSTQGLLEREAQAFAAARR